MERVYLYACDGFEVVFDTFLFPYFNTATRGDVMTGYGSHALLMERLDECRYAILHSVCGPEEQEAAIEKLSRLTPVILTMDDYVALCERKGYCMEVVWE